MNSAILNKATLKQRNIKSCNIKIVEHNIAQHLHSVTLDHAISNKEKLNSTTFSNASSRSSTLKSVALI